MYILCIFNASEMEKKVCYWCVFDCVLHLFHEVSIYYIKYILYISCIISWHNMELGCCALVHRPCFKCNGIGYDSCYGSNVTFGCANNLNVSLRGAMLEFLQLW